ncbi:hypothetical protein TNCV_2415061 [Trichonephila clavipes]|nr:hypothetical protein TNCV_2415061 [Trichonephila clavipes]
MLSVDPDPVAQPVTVREENGLSIVQLISANEMYEEKEETPVDVIKDKAKGDVDPIILSKHTGVLDMQDKREKLDGKLPDFIKQIDVEKVRPLLRERDNRKTKKVKIRKQV